MSDGILFTLDILNSQQKIIFWSILANELMNINNNKGNTLSIDNNIEILYFLPFITKKAGLICD